MLWIDPNARTYVIVLSNRTYPDGARDAGPLRKKVLALVSDRLGPLTEAQVLADEPELSSFSRMAKVNETGMQAAVATGRGSGRRRLQAARGRCQPRSIILWWPGQPLRKFPGRALPSACLKGCFSSRSLHF